MRFAQSWPLTITLAFLVSGCTREPEKSPPKVAQQVATNDPALITANNRGVGLMGRFQYEDARQIFQKLVDDHPGWLDVQTNLAIALLNRQREGDERASLDVLGRVLKSETDHLRAHYCAGLLNLYLGEADAALEHFQFVADRDSQDAYAAYYVGQCLSQNGDYDKALTKYEQAIASDPYLRSAYWAASQSLRALGRPDEATLMADEFLKLDKNPRAKLVEFKYTRMGPKAEALAVGQDKPPVVPPPQGPLFADPVPLLDNDDSFSWAVRRGDHPVSITACDIDNDEDIDIFIADVLDEDSGARNAVCINNGEGKFALDRDHILAHIPDVNAALWGDYDNDGLTDVYLCRRGPNMLWRQLEAAVWEDVTASTATANAGYDTLDGALFDADHDGDLDIFCVNADGPNELLNNNLDGTFRPIAQEQGIAGDGRPSRQILPVDLDSDRDLDIIVINDDPPHEVYVNDRLWAYRPASAVDEFRNDNFLRVIASDSDIDGRIELLTIADNWSVKSWQRTDGGTWEGEPLAIVSDAPPQSAHPLISLIDSDGDGARDELSYPFAVFKGESQVIDSNVRGIELTAEKWSWSPVVLNASSGPSIVAIGETRAPILMKPGPGRHPFAAISFSGMEDQGKSMRSNASGIGTHFAARIDSMWVAGSTLRNHSGPGQSLQPIVIGLGGHDQIDFISIDWSDGVFQSEIDLAAGQHHKIDETQRQLSSCPVLFAFNGEKHEFITDLLGVGGVGYMVAPGEYARPRPWENLLLPVDALKSKDGRYILKLGEPMEEACYLDAARLVAYDIPPHWAITVDDRMNILGPEPTGQPMFYRSEILPASATNDRGEDVTTAILLADLMAAPVGELDHRFIGRLKHDHVLTLEFDRPIVNANGSPVLIADGWIEYPYSQTMFGAWQAGAEFRAPTIEAMDAAGQWHIVLEQFGYPAGMPRQMAVPLENLPAETSRLRISTNQEIYWDRISIVFTEPCSTAIKRMVSLDAADMRNVGFAHRTTGDQRVPHYNYNRRAGLWDTRHQRGFYTSFGPVDELITTEDGAVAIFGPGEEIHMEFVDDLPPLQDGWTRRFVFEARGWCKDMDLFTRDGETVEPIPGPEARSDQADALHDRFNTRLESGR